MAGYLSFFPEPLLADLCEGQVLPFVGSGLSLNAIVPPGRKMPLFGDIANHLNELMPEFIGNSTQDIVSEFAVQFGRARLVQELDKMLMIGVADPGSAHIALAQLPFEMVVTTNFDQLLDEAYFAVKRFPQVVMFDQQLPVKDVTVTAVQFLKIHGDINFPDRIIVTEKDYARFITRFPLLVTYLANLLITRTPLFIGYRLDDYDFRQIWTIIGKRLGRLRRHAYAIEVAASPSTIARYGRRGVQVVNLPGRREDFGQILTETFLQLNQFLATRCLPPVIPPCAALSVPIDVGSGNEAALGRVDGKKPWPTEPDDDSSGISCDKSDSHHGSSSTSCDKTSSHHHDVSDTGDDHPSICPRCGRRRLL